MDSGSNNGESREQWRVAVTMVESREQWRVAVTMVRAESSGEWQ